MNINEAAALLAEFLKASKKATPGPWEMPGSNVFRLFAWKDCGEDGVKPLRCIVPDSMANVYYGVDSIKWPENDEAAKEAYANIRLIALARQVPDALVLLLKRCLPFLQVERARRSWDGFHNPVDELIGAITPLLGEEEK